MEQYSIEEKPLQLSDSIRQLMSKNLVKEVREAIGTSGRPEKAICVYLNRDYPISVVWLALDELGATSQWIIKTHGLVGSSPFILIS